MEGALREGSCVDELLGVIELVQKMIGLIVIGMSTTKLQGIA